MLAKVIMLKKSWKTVASAANYVVDDLKKRRPNNQNQATTRPRMAPIT
jgi:hypothetical protein